MAWFGLVADTCLTSVPATLYNRKVLKSLPETVSWLPSCLMSKEVVAVGAVSIPVGTSW